MAAEVRSPVVRLIAEACEGCGRRLIEGETLREACEGERVACSECGMAYVRTMTPAGYSDRNGVPEVVLWPGWRRAVEVVS